MNESITILASPGPGSYDDPGPSPWANGKLSTNEPRESHTHIYKNVTCHTPNFDFTPNVYTTKKLSSAVVLSLLIPRKVSILRKNIYAAESKLDSFSCLNKDCTLYVVFLHDSYNWIYSKII